MTDSLRPFASTSGTSRRYDATRIAAEWAAPDFRCRLVDVAHHQEQHVPDSKRVALPRPLDGIRPPASIHSRERSVFAGRVDPCDHGARHEHERGERCPRARPMYPQRLAAARRVPVARWRVEEARTATARSRERLT